MANQNQGRKAYLERNTTARGWAALNHALNQQLQVTPDPSVLPKNSLNGKSAVIVGSGVAGLKTARPMGWIGQPTHRFLTSP